jgi:hypothetical protein
VRRIVERSCIKLEVTPGTRHPRMSQILHGFSDCLDDVNSMCMF